MKLINGCLFGTIKPSLHLTLTDKHIIKQTLDTLFPLFEFFLIFIENKCLSYLISDENWE